MKIEIWSDIACPWCYVGKRRFERALAGFPERYQIEVVWRSFELDPSAPAVREGSQAELLAAKYRVSLAQAESMNANMTAQAKAEGLDFHFDRVRVGNTFDAHRLIHFAATHGVRAEMVERLFRAYLSDGEALGDRGVLVRLGADVGLDASATEQMLASGAFADAVRADEDRARAFGISGVPFFAIDERYGVSGAQPPEVLLEALRQAWSESAANAGSRGVESGTRASSQEPAGQEQCEDGSCAV